MTSSSIVTDHEYIVLETCERKSNEHSNLSRASSTLRRPCDVLLVLQISPDLPLTKIKK